MGKDIVDIIKEDLFDLKIKDCDGDLTPYIHVNRVAKSIVEIESYYLKMCNEILVSGIEWKNKYVELEKQYKVLEKDVSDRE